MTSPLVALLAEGVDRNIIAPPYTTLNRLSPSSRRAWIEMVALCARGFVMRSPSSRRAWIEIFLHELWYNIYRVALLAEGVDRNC